MANQVTPDTLLGKLMPGTVHQIERRLQMNSNWERAAAEVTRHDGSRIFDYTDIQLMSQHGITAARQLIRTLVTEGYTVGWFLEVMRQAELYNTADYLTVDVMGGDPLPRVRNIQEPPLGQTNLPGPTPPGGRDGRGYPRRIPSEHASVDTYGFPTTTYQQRESPSGGVPFPYGPSSLPSERSLRFDDIVSADMGSLQLGDGNQLLGETSDIHTMSFLNPDSFIGLPRINKAEGQLHRFPYATLYKVTRGFDTIPKPEGGHLVGAGGVGEVFYARYNNEQLAIKRILHKSPVASTDINPEVEKLSRLKHKNILQLLGYSDDDSKYYCIVYAYMVNGSLDNCLACKNNRSPLSVERRIDIALGLAEGIQYLHSLQIIHRDVKSANVLLDEELKVKLGDFGIARHCPNLADPINTSYLVPVLEGTIAYMAPEIFQDSKISFSFDVYSYGVVLQELLTAMKPYDKTREDPSLPKHIEEECGEDVKKLMQMIDKKVAADFPEPLVAAIFSLSLRCLAHKKKDRPSIVTVIKELNLLP